MNKKEGKGKIERLVNKFIGLTSAERRKKNESMACKDFILPLFQALGWDVYNNISNNEVTSETQVSGGRADYAFHVNDVIKFFIEAKKPSVDLREAKHGEQAISYAWHKSVPWAVLTDFEDIKVYNAEWDEPDAERSLIFEINYKDFLKDEKLWWLSKESMLKGDLDKYAEENFKKPKKEAVDKLLADDLVKWRTFLFKDLKGWNSDKNLSDKQIAESVQRLLDRLVFIRTTEDRKIEGEKLREIVRNWEDGKGKLNLADEMKKLFKDYDKGYNSKLFEPAICDALEYENQLLANIIKELYKNAKGIRYDFASINADILGSIYEQYLGQIQQEEKDKKSGKRKSQGIYYTPRYIVDYIVKNTLGELLKGKSGFEASKIKILDPACGSGSFLIKAFEVLDNHIRRENNELDADAMKNYARKVSLLTSNIYGVDLDQEAIEIAQLNLLLKVLVKRERLPNLGHNIECGNSLISGKEEELKKYFGENYKDKKPFNWQEKFKSVFKNGGFDVIIGNPPYIDSEEIVKTDKNFRIYCSDEYESAKGNWDIFCIFIQRGLDLLKIGGYFGMIMPNKLLSADYAASIREIIKKYSIISINDYSNIKVFGASVYPIVIIIKKDKPNNQHQFGVNIYKEVDGQVVLENKNFVKQEFLNNFKNSWSTIFNYNENINFIERIMSSSKKLEELCNVHGAATVSEAYEIKNIIFDTKDNKIDNGHFKFINTGTIDRYISLWDKRKTQYIKQSYLKPIVLKKDLEKTFPRRYKESSKQKIIIAGMVKKFECYLDEKGVYLAGKSTTIVESEKVDIKFILGILNSKLITFIYKNIFKSLSLAGGYLRIGSPQLKQLPIIIPSKNEIIKVVKGVNEIISLNQKLQKLHPIMDEKEYNVIKEKIAKTDKEIDEKVYELYGLTEEEIAVVEGNK